MTGRVHKHLQGLGPVLETCKTRAESIKCIDKAYLYHSIKSWSRPPKDPGKNEKEENRIKKGKQTGQLLLQWVLQSRSSTSVSQCKQPSHLDVISCITVY